MAKNKPVKEAGTAVVVALVFFVLTTIGLGVFCYVLFSDQEKYVAEAEKEKKTAGDARTIAAEAQDTALVYKAFVGVTKPEDAEKLAAIKEGSKAFQERKELQDAARAKGVLDAGAAGGSLLDLVARERAAREAAVKKTDADSTQYEAARASLQAEIASQKASGKVFADKSVSLPKEFDAKLAELTKLADQRRDEYQKAAAAARAEIEKLTDEREKLKTTVLQQERKISEINEQNGVLQAKIAPPDPFQYDEPQGKLTARPDDKVVEINLGSNARVTPGLTFTVLPRDFPSQGKQSRMQVRRIPDERGVMRSVPVFVPKAIIEVIEVLGPDLSRARITDEPDDVKDRVLPGDLLYNSVWRKGHADHVALAGIFDTNGDGSDDVEAVVRDLSKMGIPVDAYLDLKTGKWVGKLTDQTRMVVEGYTPTTTASEGNLEAKVKLIGMIRAAKDEAKGKAIPVVSFRDFFGRTGYKARIDVTEDRINQAATRYLSGVNQAEAPPPN